MYDDFLTITHGYNSRNQGFLFKEDITYIKEREYQIILILEKTKKLLEQKGKVISIEELRNEAESRKIAEDLKNGWDFPIQIVRLITILDLMIQLFNHNREVSFEGFDHPENADVI